MEAGQAQAKDAFVTTPQAKAVRNSTKDNVKLQAVYQFKKPMVFPSISGEATEFA